MRTIAFLSQKGGSGKSTLAVHIAVAAEEAKERVVVIDTDPQQSATAWGEAREAETPRVIDVAASDMAKVLKAAAEDGMTLCVVDTPPHSSPAAALVASQAGLLVIPCRPTAFDVAAVASTVRMVKDLRCQAVLVLTQVRPRSADIAKARQALAKHGLPIFEGEITSRTSFARAVETGSAVTEFESNGLAAAEIRSLWKWLRKNTK